MILNARGFTLTELLVTFAVVGLVMAGVLSLLLQGQRTYSMGAARVEAQQNARVAIERMTHEIRAAGYAPTASEFTAIVNPTETSLTLQNDWNGDGVIGGSGEVVTYLFRGTTLRRNAGGGAQPVVEGVERLRFAYLDAAGIATTDPKAIRTVEVSITTASEHAGASGSAGRVGVVMTTSVRLRNR
jgi:prepilin-type N-terminal cleavage/methylation domain-containing protein